MLLIMAALASPACGQPGSDPNTSSDRLSVFSIAGHRYHSARSIQFGLPVDLTEISGLALDDQAQLHAHEDEQGIVYQIDHQAGRITRRFGLQGMPEADFEGIAWLNDRLYLTTSSGRLYAFQRGAADAVVPYETFTDGLDCEVEGLTRSVDGKALLAACKNRPKGKMALHFHRWEPGAEQWSDEPAIRIKRSAFDPLFESMGMRRPEKFQPTAITTTPTGHYLILAGKQNMLLEVSEDGRPLAAARLDATMHRQPEGISMTDEGVLIIADEGASVKGSGANRLPGTLTVYRPGNDQPDETGGETP